MFTETIETQEIKGDTFTVTIQRISKDGYTDLIVTTDIIADGAEVPESHRQAVRAIEFLIQEHVYACVNIDGNYMAGLNRTVAALNSSQF